MPCLSSKITPFKSRTAGNTYFDKQFPGGSITLIGANSAAGTRTLSCKWILQDEIDSDRANIEGDPVSQADGRAENFHDAVFFKASTPTLKSSSRIWALWERSDQRTWLCPCPKCGHFQPLVWSMVRWEEGKPETAHMVCQNPQCKSRLSDFDRVRMIMAGQWKATHPLRKRRGYHLNGIYRVMGKKRSYASYLHEFVEGFLNAKHGGRETLRVWINTFLAEPFEDKTERVEEMPIMARRERYGLELPAGVLCITAAVDVHPDSLDVLVMGWGVGEESWALRHEEITGNVLKPGVWTRLDEILNERRQHPSGAAIPISICLIDSGDGNTQVAVYRFVQPRQIKRVFASKGSNVLGSPLVQSFYQKGKHTGIKLVVVGTDTAKSTVYRRLALTDPGNGFIHFPMHFTKEFFEQACAEEVQTVMRKGFARREWHLPQGKRNEALDLLAYNIAAFESLNPVMDILAKKLSITLNKQEREAQPRRTIKPRTFAPVRFSRH
jgi:phage terminase large subunit GpA-like protein